MKSRTNLLPLRYPNSNSVLTTSFDLLESNSSSHFNLFRLVGNNTICEMKMQKFAMFVGFHLNPFKIQVFLMSTLVPQILPRSRPTKIVFQNSELLDQFDWHYYNTFINQDMEAIYSSSPNAVNFFEDAVSLTLEEFKKQLPKTIELMPDSQGRMAPDVHQISSLFRYVFTLLLY
jgi:hypothetical protein